MAGHFDHEVVAEQGVHPGDQPPRGPVRHLQPRPGESGSADEGEEPPLQPALAAGVHQGSQQHGAAASCRVVLGDDALAQPGLGYQA